MDGVTHDIPKWDIIIAHPPCTYLTNTGNRWFNIDRYGDKARKRYKDREDAVKLFMAFVNADCERIAIENPIGYMSTAYRKADQIIQPYEFGHPARKATCLWLKGLPKLKPTEIVKPEIKQYKSKDGSIKSVSADYGSGNADSASRRSKTYLGIAQAMAEQWGVKQMNLTADNYFSAEANRQYMSVSQFKSFLKCPAAALAELNGEYQREQTTALLVGSYVDAYFSGEMEQFISEHPEIFKRDGTLKAEYAQADQIIARVSKDEMFMEYMSGDKQVIMTGEIEGVPVKIKIDSLLPDKIVDLKIVRDFEPIYDPDFCSRVPWWVFWRYDLQGAVYQEVVRQNTGKQLPFFLAAATKEKVTDYNIYHLVQGDLDVALQTVKDSIVRFDAMKKGIIPADRCECCDYCRSTKKLTEVISSDSILI